MRCGPVFLGCPRAAPPAWVAALRVCMALRVHAGRRSGCWGAQHARVRLPLRLPSVLAR